MIDPEFYKVKVFPTIVFLNARDEIYGRIERPLSKEELLKTIETIGKKFGKKPVDE